MKYRIAIRAFTLRRDLPQAYVLSRILENMGCETMICCTRNYHRVLDKWKPHAAVINTVGKINSTIDVDPEAKVIVWPAEGARAPHSSDAVWIKELMPEGTIDKIDLLLLWGDFTRRAFLQYFPESLDRKIVICGHPKLDLIKYKPKRHYPEKSIGFLTKFPGLNFYNRKPTITPMIENCAGSVKMLKLQIDQFAVMLNAIESLAAEGRHPISVRPHPLEAPEGYVRLLKKYPGKIDIDEGADFADWAERQKVIVTPASSSFIDLNLIGVPVVSIDNMLMKEHPLIEETQRKVVVTSLDGNSYKPSDFNEMMEMVKSDLKPIPEEPKMGAYNRDVYDWPSEVSAIRRAATAIMNYLDNCGSLRQSQIHCPKPLLDAYDLYHFYKAKYLAGEYHENFNYKSGYHKIPQYYEEIVGNIMANKPVLQ